MGNLNQRKPEVEMTIQRFPTTEAELSALIKSCQHVHCELGGALLWDDTKPMPEAVLKLAKMRGAIEEQPPKGRD